MQGDFQICISVPLSRFLDYILLLSEACLEPIGTSMVAFFVKINYLHKEVPSQIFSWVLNMTLSLYAVIGIQIMVPKSI